MSQFLKKANLDFTKRKIHRPVTKIFDVNNQENSVCRYVHHRGCRKDNKYPSWFKIYLFRSSFPIPFFFLSGISDTDDEWG